MAMSVFWDKKEGFSTLGMVLALLISISLLFCAARVYEINSASADIQDVADAAALAAENTVAEFYVVASVCDALVLSLSLGTVLCLSLGVACSCTPVSLGFAQTFFKVSHELKSSRDKVYKNAQSALERYETMLPFLAIAQAQEVLSANSQLEGNGTYSGVALLVPWQSGNQSALSFTQSDAAQKKVEANAEELQEHAKEAEELAKQARKSKERAYQHDSGSESQYCMHERASHLAELHGSENPYCSSVDTWDFSVALKRAQVYYQKRAEQERPHYQSVNEESNSVLRKHFYEFAAQELQKGYVHETGDTFKAHFPLLPKNTKEMRKTSLYTAARYPISFADKSRTMHAWEGCPHYAQETPHGVGSIKDLESGQFKTCSACKFSAASMGQVASASTNIDNGFEYHYLVVAKEAKVYQKARERLAPAHAQAKKQASSLFSSLKEALQEVAAQRIEVAPPGRFGVVCVAINQDRPSWFKHYASLFVSDKNDLGTCVALSSATLVKEDSSEKASLLSEFANGITGDAPALGPARIAFDLWSGLLQAYTDGHEAVLKALEQALGSIRFSSESGLGFWARDALSEIVKDLGLAPADLASPKAVLVNSEHVLAQDQTDFSSRLLSVKHAASTQAVLSGNFFGGIVDVLQDKGNQVINSFEDGFCIATLEIFDGALAIPITLKLPGFVAKEAQGLLAHGISELKGLVAKATGVRLWR